jgi:hypothetical protein
MKTVLLGAAVITAATAVFAAPAASASPGSFLEEISINGATLPGKTPDQMVAAGQGVCKDLRGGVTVLDEMAVVEKAYAFNQGALFVSASTTHLCPDFAGG